MKILATTAAAALLAVPAFAQQTVTAETTTGLYTSAADVAAAVAKLPKNKGDFMLVPAGVPHWFTDISGQITEFSLHLPVK
jgi:uncharacterized RmlC-like cupin family protein